MRFCNGIHTTNAHCFLLILFGIIYLVIGLCNHYFFRTYGYDYAMYNFAFYDYAHFRISDTPVHLLPHINFLQDHVSFTLMIFIPFYWLLGWLTGTYTLLIIQTAIILYGGWAVYQLLIFKTKSNFLSSLALFQYLFILGRWISFTNDFTTATIASSMIPVFLYYFETKKHWPALLTFLFILASREDMPLWTAFIGIFLLVSHRGDRKQQIASLLVIALSCIYFVLVFTVIIPALETEYKKFSMFSYSALGQNPYEALIFIVKHPVDTLKLFFVNHSGDPAFDGIKQEFYVYYLIFGGFLLFFKPRYLLLFIPILAKKMLNDHPVRWSMELYYSIEFVSILPVAVFLIISELKSPVVKRSMAIIVCAATLVLTIYGLYSPHRRLNWWGDSKYAFYKCSFYNPGFSSKKVHRYLKIIPADAAVSASGNFTPNLAFRPKIYYFPRVDDATYLVLHLNSSPFPVSKERYDTEIAAYRGSDEWEEMVNDNGFLILKRRTEFSTNKEVTKTGNK